MGKKLIICCDGTGNEIKENESNVLKFYRLIKKDGTRTQQIAYYDTGVGTISESDAWSRFKSKAIGIFGLITGYGLDTNVLDAYEFLSDHYEEDDEIYLLGFSRGAYTVRVLAGFVHMVGILKPENRNLMRYAFTTYKQASESDDYSAAWKINEVLDSHRATIRFMGCWDTVSSVIIPRPDRAYLPSFEKLAFTKVNPSVHTFRHALAIDEKRRMFRVYPWEEDQIYKSNPFVKDENAEKQDSQQVWFIGVHSDIGGGYPEAESGLAKIPLAWMVKEAEHNGLEFRSEMVKRLVEGRNPKNATRIYSAPDPNAKLHNSITCGWKILEYLPKRDKHKEWKERESFFGFYLPLRESRPVGENTLINESIRNRESYNPENL